LRKNQGGKRGSQKKRAEIPHSKKAICSTQIRLRGADSALREKTIVGPAGREKRLDVSYLCGMATSVTKFPVVRSVQRERKSGREKESLKRRGNVL